MPPLEELSEEKLLFRRQFILGTEFLSAPASWNRISVRERIRVTAHPDLPLSQERSDSRSVTLLGFALDPFEPASTDADIVKELLARLAPGAGFGHALERLHDLGGRWVVILDDGREVRLFHDAMGLRQVFYTTAAADSGFWVASQPSLLAEHLALIPDPDAVA